jgi:hypothetical protein
MSHISPAMVIVLFLGFGLLMAAAIIWPEKI